MQVEKHFLIIHVTLTTFSINRRASSKLAVFGGQASEKTDGGPPKDDSRFDGKQEKPLEPPCLYEQVVE